jgi:HK97 family phage prohead protease
MLALERRLTSGASISFQKKTRAAGDTTIGTAFGYGACFWNGEAGTQYALAPGLRERIMPTAFDRCLRERQDVRGLFNHSADLLLGRTASGTMRLVVDGRGLRYEIDLPDTQIGRDVATSIERGDLSGSSFSFRIVKQTFSMSSAPDAEDDIRLIEDVDVYDVGPVTFPAYEATTAGMRALGELCAELRSAWQSWRKAEHRGAVT